ncbi:OLC1v1035321C1 [Oldenlandia corymbosa var. corymbosa]|uniref:WAT1-related protein n=1 Tax=Oldenlandia corymbosa var. corymbosa TaxID=529605 RepID=A0AAV1CTG3_OLDCO|nr:OLC1v1035321C1 [Oldenlandia corymbosa var. corymbosa]
MGSVENQKPVIVMLMLQFLYSAVTLFTRATFVHGMSPRVFVVYRQGLAFLLIAPIAFLRKGTSGCSLGLKNFGLIFLISLIGITINQNIYFEGLYLSSSSIASAMGNILPAITFLMAYSLGLERVNFKSVRSIAKIFGTIVCVTGAISMVLLKGPKLLNMEFNPRHMLFSKGGETWLLGCFLIFTSNFCWSLWLILQVPVSKSYPDHICLTAWMCLFGSMQSGVVSFFLEKDLDAWKINSPLQLGCLLFTAAAGATSFFAQAWCIERRGPLFSAMFNPLNTVIVTFLATTFVHEEMYLGSLIGAIAVIFGLYVVLWGKAQDQVEIDAEKKPEEAKKCNSASCIDESVEKTSYAIDLEEPLLSNKE